MLIPRDTDKRRRKECAARDEAREAADELLLQNAFDQAKPILGICYGLQSLNVWRRGTLIQDLPHAEAANGSIVNHQPGRQVQESTPRLGHAGFPPLPGTGRRLPRKRRRGSLSIRVIIRRSTGPGDSLADRRHQSGRRGHRGVGGRGSERSSWSRCNGTRSGATRAALPRAPSSRRFLRPRASWSSSAEASRIECGPQSK